MSTLCGIGYDSHRLVAGRRLLLGGVQIPHELGASGHSDADVLAHAVITPCSAPPGSATSASTFPTPTSASQAPTPSACSAKSWRC